jgi:ankyrin repeat protein
MVNKALETPLMLASGINGDLRSVKLLLAQPVDIDAQDRYGWTALAKAAQRGSMEAVRELLLAGADPTLLTNEGVSCAALATGGNSIVVALVEDAALQRTTAASLVSALRSPRL